MRGINGSLAKLTGRGMYGLVEGRVSPTELRLTLNRPILTQGAMSILHVACDASDRIVV